MTIVAEFAAELARRAPAKCGRWSRIDLHNHTPESFDYRYGGADVIERLADRIKEKDLSIVMFTDHERLPDRDFTEQLAKRSGRTIIRGTELNVFVDVFDKDLGKINKDLFYHLLVGFDPDGKYPPDYWLEDIYRNCSAI